MNDEPEDGYMLQVFYQGRWSDWWPGPPTRGKVQALGGVGEVLRFQRECAAPITEPMRIVRWTAEIVVELR